MITIRNFIPEDAHTVYRYSSDFENTYYMLNNPFSSLEEASTFVEKCIKAYGKEVSDGEELIYRKYFFRGKEHGRNYLILCYKQ